MKIIGIFILGIFVVHTLGNKGPQRKSRPHGRPHHRPSPQNREELEINEKGWGWNGPPAYETFSCVNPSTIVQANFQYDFYSRLRLWYLTGNTIYGYSLLARIFLGRPVASQDELNQMCPTHISSYITPEIYNLGYGRIFRQHCDNGTVQVSCPIVTDPSTYDGALGVDIFSGYVNQVVYIVGTDNSTYTIWYLCNDDTYGDLQLLTTTPYASPEAVAAFKAMAIQFGIPLSQLQLLQCNSPYQGPYPAPFQNYPNGNGWSNNATGWEQPPPTNGWSQNPPTNGWSKDPAANGWSQNPLIDVWSQNAPSNSVPPILGSNPPSNPPSNGWSGSNNGWGGHSTFLEKQSDVKEESVKLAEEKPKA